MDLFSYILGKKSGGGGSNIATIDPSLKTYYSTSNGLVSIISKVETIDLGEMTTLSGFFKNCINLESLPQIDTKNVTTFSNMCVNCYALKNVPIYDTTSLTTMASCFNMCAALTDESLDNILQMCINASSYTATKTLNAIGIKSSNYAASRIEALSHYSDFTTAGWSTGF